MQDNESTRDTVTIEQSVQDIYRQLTEGNDPVTAPFRTMKDVFMWALQLGYKRNERRPLKGKRVTIFRRAQFLPQIDIPLLKAAAISATGEISVLLQPEDILTIAEEYANAGIHELRANLLDDYGQPLWNLVRILKEVGGI